MSLEIKNLHVSVEGKQILKGLSLNIQKGEVHAIMGPNGSGKSTLSNVLMGHPKYTVESGEIILDGENITHEKVVERAKKGLFLSMQYAPEIQGVTVNTLLRTAINALESPPVGGSTGGLKKQHPVKFYKKLTDKMQELKINQDFAARSLNTGFSGGEKNRMEILQLLMLQPQYAILDETDSGQIGRASCRERV